MIIGIEASHVAKEQRTGVEEAVWQIIQALKKQIPSTTKVILYSHKNLKGALAELPQNWEIKILRWPFKKMWSQFRLAWELIFNPPDVFFAPAQLLPLFCPKNSVVYLHDSAFLAQPKVYRFWGRQYLRLMNWWIVKKSRLILTSSEFNKQEILKYYSLKNVEARIKIAPLAFDSEKYNSFMAVEMAAKLAKEKFNVTTPYILFVGRLEEKKNVRTLVQAFSNLRAHNQVQLVLVGKPGFGFDLIEREIKKCPYAEDIIFPGWVKEEDLPILFRAAKIFALPSWYEGFGLPILESLGSGCPVVAADIPALREVGGEAVDYFAPQSVDQLSQVMQKILIDENYRQARIKVGLDRARGFSWSKTAALVWQGLIQK